MFGLAAEEDEERRRQRKLEEALEIQSLRRIISAYLNYPEAAEQDVRRYERSYRKLSPSHKALLSHYPMKFRSLRRCISVNCYFIFSMLQAFEPPLDICQETEICEESCLSKAPNDHLLPAEEKVGPCHPPSLQEGNDYRNNNLVCTGDPGKESCKARVTSDEATKPDCCPESTCGSCLSVCKTSKSDYMDSTRHDWLDPSIQLDVPLVDVDKVRCIIRNIVRDWAVEGQKERDQCYKPILEELNSLFTDRHRDKPPTCLVPGAGLGRLALEISCLGFVSQGNEFSYYMMICSSFILNHSQTVGEWTIYPWIHSNCNSLSDSDQLRAVSIPDIHPASAGITDGFSMCGGDFVEVYSDPSQVGAWDAVVTCFFIDTAHNVIEYIEIISRILKDGGVWINLGPLLYHFADAYGQEDEMSVELSLEDVRRVALHHGFQIKKETTIETTYTTNPRSMMQNRYSAAFWTMEKKSVALGDL